MLTARLAMTTLANPATVADRYRTYFNKKLLYVQTDELRLDQFGLHEELPAKEGSTTMRFFKPALAGRALSAFNLVIFSGVFIVQWGIGLLVDAFAVLGLARVASFQASFGVYLCCSIAAYVYFLRTKVDNSES